MRRGIEQCTHSHDAGVFGRSKKDEGKDTKPFGRARCRRLSYWLPSRNVREDVDREKAERMRCEEGLLKGQSQVQREARWWVESPRLFACRSSQALSVCGTHHPPRIRGDSTSFRRSLTWHKAATVLIHLLPLGVGMIWSRAFPRSGQASMAVTRGGRQDGARASHPVHWTKVNLDRPSHFIPTSTVTHCTLGTHLAPRMFSLTALA
jgi:hypothetical protein